MTWCQLARLAVELAIDAVRGKLGPLQPSEPSRPPLPWLDVERQARASRCAGHESEPWCR